VKKDELFLDGDKRAGDFEFDADVAEVFDDMLERSIPYYREQQSMVGDLARKHWVPETTVYDLGCSTGTTLVELCRALPACARFCGYDNSPPMLERAKRKLDEHGVAGRIELREGDLNGPLAALPLHNASVVTMCWTLQFIRPLRRGDLIRWIHDARVDGGALIVTEKVLTNNGHLNRHFIDSYYDFKRRQGYSETEIARKREALENVLVPYRLDENLDLFRDSGFAVAETFFQWFNFAGFVCVRKAHSRAV
jgi:tRNA (cmo5U34)-methyltransferase